jgi:hypothetical protein
MALLVAALASDHRRAMELERNAQCRKARIASGRRSAPLRSSKALDIFLGLRRCPHSEKLRRKIQRDAHLRPRGSPRHEISSPTSSKRPVLARPLQGSAEADGSAGSGLLRQKPKNFAVK